MPRRGISATLPAMRYRIQADDGRRVEWEQDGPAVFRPVGEAEQLVHPALMILTEAEATELWLEFSYQIMKLRHPERNWPE